MPAMHMLRGFRWGLGLIAALVTTFWGLQLMVSSARADLRAQMRAAPSPPALNGLKVSLAGVTPAPYNPGARAMAGLEQPRRTLLIITSDTCEFCRRLLPAWRQLLATLPLHPEDAAIIASF